MPGSGVMPSFCREVNPLGLMRSSQSEEAEDLRNCEQELFVSKTIWMCGLGLMAALTPVRADWKITTATTDLRGEESVRTDYYKGKLQRSDIEGNRAHPYVVVLDVENRRETVWDASAKQYSVISLRRERKPVAAPTAAGLSQELFEPPADCKRVAQLPGAFVRRPSLSDEIEMYWNSLEYWLLSWFS